MDILITLGLMAASIFPLTKVYDFVVEKILRKWDENLMSQIPPMPVQVRYLGGPLDGHVDLISADSRKPFFIAPYIPQDESQRGEQFGEVHGTPLYKPNLAYYREVTDSEYFYVRDITHHELAAVMQTGMPPSV